jgi:hypothetical protein
MKPPILFLVNDQGPVLDALSDDLARRLGVDNRILSERSPTAALANLKRLADQSDEIALVIAAQRMDERPELEVLVQAHELHPTAKRILLIGRRDWSATNPAVQAMALGQIDSYLFEPWLPLERWLYLPISQVLADWVPSRAPTFEGIRIIGPQWGTRSHDLRDMLTRMGIPHGWYLADSDAGRQLLDDLGVDGSRLPIVVFHSGRVFVDPSNAELAAALGYGTKPPAESYEMVVIGAGPAGLAAAVYGAAEGLRTLVVEPQGCRRPGRHQPADPQLHWDSRAGSAATTSPTGRSSRRGCSGRTWSSPSRSPACRCAGPTVWRHLNRGTSCDESCRSSRRCWPGWRCCCRRRRPRRRPASIRSSGRSSMTRRDRTPAAMPA